MEKNKKFVLRYNEITKEDLALVGGKNASLGEMIKNLSPKGVLIPDGFATTSFAYFCFLEENGILPELKKIFAGLNIDNIENLQEIGKKARKMVSEGEFSEEFKNEIIEKYREMGRKYGKNPEVAVRSSATAEDLPGASFAGLHETYLNVSGEKDLLLAVKKCIVSLFGDRVISYRESKGFDHFKIALSVGVQKMVRSDIGSSGVMFTMDTESGFEGTVLISSIWGVGEMIVQGKITPDEFYIFKPAMKEGYKSIILKNLGRKNKKFILSPAGGLKEVPVPAKDQLIFSLSDEDAMILAKWGVVIEEHYKIPQDIEWAKDGKTGNLFIVQSRPETIHSEKKERYYEEYYIESGHVPILEGIAIGDKIGYGKIRVIPDVSQIKDFKKGEVLVTKMTDPDWVSIMRMAGAIITDQGGKVCHAAIISRELGIPAIVGTEIGTEKLKTGKMVTVDCTQGLKGRIFSGKVPYKTKRYNLDKVPKLKTKIMLNVGTPDMAFKNSFLPNDGVGLAREEFIIAEKIRIHPLALYHYESLKNKRGSSQIKKIVKKIEEMTMEHKDKKEYFIKELAEGMAQIAAAFYPNEVIVRFSDFKTNEYKNLIGGELFEGEESNPMLGFRGACRYLDKEFQPAFEMECQAIKRIRDVFGLKNVSVMVPFCRTIKEGKEVIALIRKFGLDVGKSVKIYVMCEIPSNVILADKFLDIFDGMSIGSNDLLQLVLGLDRDNGKIAYIGDERDESVKKMISDVIKVCNRRGKYLGICGQAPSDFPDFAEFLIKEGIGSISLNTDTVIKTIMRLSPKLDL